MIPIVTQVVSLGFVCYLCSSCFLRALRKNTAQLGLLYLLIMKAYLCLNPQQYMQKIERKSGEAKRSEAKRWRTYRKIPKISPGVYIFQRPFLRGLFLEGLVFGGAYLRREICGSKSIGLIAYSWK